MPDKPDKPDNPQKDKTEVTGPVKEDPRPKETGQSPSQDPGPDHTPNYKRTLSYIIIAVIILISILARYSKTPEKTKTYVRLLMGTVVEITLHGKERESAEARAATNSAFVEIERLEALLSRYQPDSDVSRIRAAVRVAGEKVSPEEVTTVKVPSVKVPGIKVPGEKVLPVKVSPEVIEVVELALEAARLSGGAFDPTIGPVTSLWDFSDSDIDDGSVPPPEEIAARVGLVGYKGVVVDKASGTVALGAGMSLDLGGVAKGYIVGRAINILKEHGIRWAIVTAGGDIYAFDDESLLGGGFSIGVQDPRSPSELVGTVEVKDGAVTTSGDYERYFMEDGVRYHHIIDPQTGYPVGVRVKGEGEEEEVVIASEVSQTLSAANSGEKEGEKWGEEGGEEGGEGRAWLERARDETASAPGLAVTDFVGEGEGEGEGPIVRPGPVLSNVEGPVEGRTEKRRGTFKEDAETLMSVTIVSKRPAMADALSTAVFVMGATEGMALIESLPWAEGAVVDRTGVITTSKGLEGEFGQGG